MTQVGEELIFKNHYLYHIMVFNVYYAFHISIINISFMYMASIQFSGSIELIVYSANNVPCHMLHDCEMTSRYLMFQNFSWGGGGG